MAAADKASSSDLQVRAAQVLKAMLRMPRSPVRVPLVPKAMLRLPRPIAASSTSLKGEGTAEPVRPTGQDSNDAPRPSLSATRGERLRGIFEAAGRTLDEIKLIVTAARWPESCHEGICVL